MLESRRVAVSFVEGLSCPGQPQLWIVAAARSFRQVASLCRISAPYLQQKYSYEQIIEIMPVLTVNEIQLVENYIQEHYQQVMEQDRHIREGAWTRKVTRDRAVPARLVSADSNEHAMPYTSSRIANGDRASR